MSADPVDRDRRRALRRDLKILAAGFAALAAVAVPLGLYLQGPVVATAAASPSGRWAAEVRQPRLVFLDRNFEVFLTDRRTGAERRVFVSQDQSPLVKEERLVWAADSRAFALVGDDYYVVPGAALPSGSTLFLTYDLPTGTLRCNTDHARPLPATPPADPAAAGRRFGAGL